MGYDQETFIGSFRIDTSKLYADITKSQKMIDDFTRTLSGNVDVKVFDELQTTLTGLIDTLNKGIMNDKLQDDLSALKNLDVSGINDVTKALKDQLSTKGFNGESGPERVSKMIDTLTASGIAFRSIIGSLNEVNDALKEISLSAETVAHKNFTAIINNSFKGSESAADEQKAKLNALKDEVIANLKYSESLVNIWMGLGGAARDMGKDIMAASGNLDEYNKIMNELRKEDLTKSINKAGMTSSRTVLTEYKEEALWIQGVLLPMLEKLQATPDMGKLFTLPSTAPIESATAAITEQDEKYQKAADDASRIREAFSTPGISTDQIVALSNSIAQLGSNMQSSLGGIGSQIENLKTAMMSIKFSQLFNEQEIEKLNQQATSLMSLPGTLDLLRQSLDSTSTAFSSFTNNPFADGSGFKQMEGAVQNVSSTLTTLEETMKRIKDSFANTSTLFKFDPASIKSGFDQVSQTIQNLLGNTSNLSTTLADTLKKGVEEGFKPDIISTAVKQGVTDGLAGANLADSIATSVKDGVERGIQQSNAKIVAAPTVGSVPTGPSGGGGGNNGNGFTETNRSTYFDENGGQVASVIRSVNSELDTLIVRADEAGNVLGSTFNSASKEVREAQQVLVDMRSKIEELKGAYQDYNAVLKDQRASDSEKDKALQSIIDLTLQYKDLEKEAQNYINLGVEVRALTAQINAGNKVINSGDRTINNTEQMQQLKEYNAALEAYEQKRKEAAKAAIQAAEEARKAEVKSVQDAFAEEAKARKALADISVREKGADASSKQVLETQVKLRQQELAAAIALTNQVASSVKTEAGRVAVKEGIAKALKQEAEMQDRIAAAAKIAENRETEAAAKQRQKNINLANSEAQKAMVAAIREEVRLTKELDAAQLKSVNSTGAEQQAHDQIIATNTQRIAQQENIINAAAGILGLTEQEVNALKVQLGLTNAIAKGEANRQGAKRSFGQQLTDSFTNIPNTMVQSLTFSLTNMIARLPLRAIQQFWNSAWEYATKYYDQLNEIRVVTGKSEEEAARLGTNLRNLASTLSVSSADLAKSATVYYRQGLSDDQVEQRLVATTQYAKTAGVAFDDAANLITAAINSIDEDANGMEMTAKRVADVYLYLGDNAASSGKEIGDAMQKSAALADQAGVSFEMLGAYIATVSETTRQDAGSIGTALNAIMSRLTQVKTKGFNDEDETKVNDVAKALNAVGIQLVDNNGKWRNLSEIFQEVGSIWDNLDNKTQNYLATIMAGTRQQNVFRVLMGDLSKVDEGTSRIMELYTGALNSAGTAQEKYATYMDSVTAAQDRMKASLEKLYAMFNVAVLKDFYNAVADIAGALGDAFSGVSEQKNSGVIDFLSDETKEIEGQIRKYKDLAQQQTLVAVGSASYNSLSKEMAGIIENLTTKYAGQNVSLMSANGNWKSGGEALAAMNGYLEDEIRLLREAQAVQDLSNFYDDKQLSDAASRYGRDVRNERNQQAVSGFFNSAFGLIPNFDGAIEMGSKEFFDRIGGITTAIANGKTTGGLIPQIMELGYGTDEDITAAIDEFFDTFGDDLAKGWLQFTKTNALAKSHDADKKFFESVISQKVQQATRGLLGSDEVFIGLENTVAAQYQKAIVDGVMSGINMVDASQMSSTEIITAIQNAVEAQIDAVDISSYVQLSEKIKTANASVFGGGIPEDISQADDAMKEYIATYQRLYKTVFGTDLSDEQVIEILRGGMLTAGDAANEASEAVETFYDKLEARRKKDEYAAKKKAGFVEEMAMVKDLAEGGEWDHLLGVFETLYDVDSKQVEDMFDAYTWLSGALDDIKKGNYGDAWRKISEGMKEAEKSTKDLTDAEKARKSVMEGGKSAQNKQRVADAKKSGFAVERGRLLSSLMNTTAARDGTNALRMYGNVDMFNRPVIDPRALAKKGWSDVGGDVATVFSSTYTNLNKDGSGIAIGITPILPDGEILSPEALDAYVDKIVKAGDPVEADKISNGGKGLVIHMIDFDEGEEEAAIEYMDEIMEAAHNYQEQLYPVELPVDFKIPENGAFFQAIGEYEQNGMLDGLYEQFPKLEAAIGLYQENAIEGSAAIVAALASESDAWDDYIKTRKSALDAEITDIEGGDIARKLAEAYDAEGYEGLVATMKTLTDAERQWATSSVKHLDEILVGTESVADAGADMRMSLSSAMADSAASTGSIWDKTGDYINKAVQGGDQWYKAMGDMIEQSDKLANAQAALDILWGGNLKDDSDEFKDALSDLSSYTGLTADYLMGHLDVALAMIDQDTVLASESVGFLVDELFTMAGVDFSADTWRDQLLALANDAETAEGRIASLIQKLLEQDKSSLTQSEDGHVGVDWGRRRYKTTKNTNSRNRSNSDRDSSSSRNKSSQNTTTDIERLVDMMEQVQSLFSYHQSMIQQIESIYSQKGELTNLLQVYQEEYDAIAKNNKVLEDNIKKLEAQIESQRQVVASLSITDEQYKQEADDLKLLQETHQKYKKQVLENAEALDKLTEAMKEQKRAIRQLEIDLEQEVLQAIIDREERNQRILSGTIKMEQEILSLIKKRYELERDAIIDNADRQVKALQEESRQLEKQLKLRKDLAAAQDKQAQLAELEEKLVRIAADPTRQKEAMKIRQEVADLREEIAWETAETEVETQQEAIDQQIDSLEDYISYVEKYYEDLFEHPTKLIEEMREVIGKTDEEIKAWLTQNSEDYKNATEAAQEDMIRNWDDMLLEMSGKTRTYWEEVEQVIEQGDEYIIAFLMENSENYINASKKQQEEYLENWKDLCDKIHKAYKDTFEAIKKYDYSTISLPQVTYTDVSVGGGSSSSSNSGGNPSYNTQPATQKTQQLHAATGSGQRYNPTTQQYEKKTYTKTSTVSRSDAEQKLREALTNAGYGYHIVISNAYKNGGLVDFTGPAWVDGTKSKPEAFLNADQTKLIGNFATLLEKAVISPMHMPATLGYDLGSASGRSVSIETINVNVEKLDTDEDYEEIANRVGEVLVKTLSRNSAVGGIRLNG